MAAVAEFRDRYGPWALVTGASAGLGAAFARALAARGLHLALVARRAEQLEALAAELRAARGVDVLPIAADLTAADALARVQSALASREVGLLVNNAGFGAAGAFLARDQAWQARMVRLNCEVPVVLSHAFLPAMVARRRGGMILVASTAAYQATPYMAVYGATKAFDLLLGEALHVELRPHGVDVLVLSPGYTESEFHAIAGVRGPATGLRMRPEPVVELALRRLGRGSAAIPGLANKAMAWSTRLVPRSWAAGVAARVLRHRNTRDAAPGTA
ncbi:MAG: SDR family NAD(P)-dependent oxidoreductase [Planctomycetota bacterium]|nr:MAG: SDR family NAD(P)-dependent oxidoreductase [Planctomycetota bacterium]